MTPAAFKQARQSLGLTQPALGAVLDYGQQHISGIESGKTPIPAAVAIAMRAMVRWGMPETWGAATPPYPACTPQ